MTHRANSPKYSLDTVLPKVGCVLKMLFEQGYKESGAILYQDLMHEMPSDTPEGMLYGALAILHGIGLVRIDEHDDVRSVSIYRHACFALGSLSKFLSAAVSAADIPEDSRQDYLVSLTYALDSARVENPQVDNESLHSRKIVNVLIKSRQIRHWKPQDVYLHVYDSKWKRYHLVGRGRRDALKTDEEVAHQALQEQVALRGYQYNLDTLEHLKELTVTRISATSGALTKYTYRLMAVKEIRVKLGLQELIEQGKFERDHFRWFTLEEIKKLKSEQGDPIMFSTPIVMEQVMDLGSIPVSAPGADDMRRPVGILNELSCRFTNKQLVALIGILLALPLLYFLPQALALAGHPCALLTNLASIARIVSVIFPLGAALVGALIALFRKSSK